MNTTTKTTAKYPWLARRIAEACGARYSECRIHWLEKAAKVASSGEWTPASLRACIDNYAWMNSIPSKRADRDVARLFAAVTF